MSSITIMQMREIEVLHKQGWTTREIARAMDVDHSSIVRVLSGKIGGTQKRIADRIEYLGGATLDSGCYSGRETLLSLEERASGDPLEMLIVMENLKEKMDGTESDY